MKQSGMCPKCHSNDIIRVPGATALHGRFNTIPTGFTLSRLVIVTRYVCGQCGFSEEWVENPEQIENLKKRYRSNRTPKST